MPARAAHHIVTVLDPGWPSCVCGTASGAGTEMSVADRVVATFAHVHAANVVAARAVIQWHVAIDGGHRVPNLTRGSRWPHMCGARSEFRRPGESVSYRVSCTRRSSHTGRHAAGGVSGIVAVWSGPRS
jgi:hypothetical protein